MNKEKIFKVAKVTNSDLIIINGGFLDEITENTRMLVFSLGEEIVDPDSGQSLGTLEIPKGYYKARHVQEKISTLIAENRTHQNSLMAITSFQKLLGGDIEQSLKNSIEVGDLVKIVNRV